MVKKSGNEKQNKERQLAPQQIVNLKRFANRFSEALRKVTNAKH